VYQLNLQLEHTDTNRTAVTNRTDKAFFSVAYT